MSTRPPSPPPWHPRAWADALITFGRTEIAGGVVLVVALIAALVWANLDPHGYVSIWAHRTMSWATLLPPGVRTVADTIDNGLMTLFFLAVGLEIGREVAEGSLQDRRNALLPVLAALGGMAGAAVVYLGTVAALHPRVDAGRGWGIPMATDVAFTLGAIALLGRRVPRSLRVFVLALAVADDVGAVVVLAFVASSKIRPGWLVAAVVVLAAVVLVRRWVRHAWWPYAVATLLAWYLLGRAGIEPTLAGAFVGILVPVAGAARAGRALEAPVHRLSSFVVLPLFVLANAGVVLTGAVWHDPGAVSVLAAVVTARLLGKMLGITLAVAVVVRLGVCGLPERTTWRHLIGVGLLCGMGITVPLLFAHAVFDQHPALFAGTQVGLLLGTVAAAVLGGLVLLTPRRAAEAPIGPDAAAWARATVPATDDTPAPPGDQHRREG